MRLQGDRQRRVGVFHIRYPNDAAGIEEMGHWKINDETNLGVERGEKYTKE